MANDFKRMWTKEELNQFLQRRLDKPSAEWNSGTSSTDLKTWLEEKLPSMHKGQVIWVEEFSGDLDTMYFMITGLEHTQFYLKPLSLYRDDQGTSFIYSALVNITTSTISFRRLNDNNEFNYTFNDIATIILY